MIKLVVKELIHLTISDSSNKKIKCSERSNNDDSFERFPVHNIACYETVEISNLSSSGSSNEGSTVLGGDLKLGNVNADNNNMDIPDDCQGHNNKIKYMFSITYNTTRRD